MRIPVLAAFLVILGGPAYAQQCTRADEMAALKVAGTLREWSEVSAAFQRYRHCDDGAIAEGFTDSIVRLLVSRWETLSEMAAFAEKQPEFRTFVLRHVDASADPGDLKRIAELAGSKCPSHHAKLCAALRAEALRK